MIFARFDGLITDRGRYMVIRTPSNPSFYWGNFLLFDHPPGTGDLARWSQLFAEEIGSPPAILHQTFGWDSLHGEVGEVQQFLSADFHLDHSTVHTATQVKPPARLAPNINIRPLGLDADWDQALENQVRCRDTRYEENSYLKFMRQEMTRYRAMSAAGMGAWFGAFIGSQLVADLGLFHDGEFGRFQSVETHPDFRRRGIASTLIYQAARYALANFGIEGLVFVADHDSAAARLYQSMGFLPREQQVGLEYFPEIAPGNG
jgi:ribosomal protein S18 acetylase RimI-like enzyme